MQTPPSRAPEPGGTAPRALFAGRRARLYGLCLPLLLAACYVCAIALLAQARGVRCWWPGYRGEAGSQATAADGPTHVVFVIADHFEPGGHAEVMDEWLRAWPRIVQGHADSSGRPPQHTWFYPVEQSRPREVKQLHQLCAQGLGEIQLHLHHHGDTAASLRGELEKGKAVLFGTRRSSFVFVHGDWALDNSRREGSRDFCGVDDEISVLREEGCTADMTFPAPFPQAQPAMVNRIYYAVDDPKRPKSHDTGVVAEAGRPGPTTGLLMIPGPLRVDWENWRHRFYPAIEDGCIQGNNPPSPGRVDAWVSTHVTVKGAGNWVFVKVHLHGANRDTRPVVLGPAMEGMFDSLEHRYNDGRRYVLHYARASEAVALVHALERGDPDPGMVLRAVPASSRAAQSAASGPAIP